MKKPVLRSRWLLLIAAVLVVAALVLGACGESSEGGGGEASPTAAASPVAGGTYNYPLTANPVSIEPVNAQESEGMQVAHQVFEGLAGYVMNDKGEMVAEPVLAESWDTTDSQTWTFHLKQGVMFQAPVSREVKAQDFVDSWNYVTDPANQSYVSYILAPVEGCDDGGYQVDPKVGLTGVTAIDDYTLEVKLRYPFAEFPQTLGHTVAAALPARLPQEDRRQGLQPEADRHRPVHGRELEEQPEHHAGQEPRLLEPGGRRSVHRHHQHADHHLESQTEWLEFQKGSIDYTSRAAGPGRRVREQPQGRER